MKHSRHLEHAEIFLFLCPFPSSRMPDNMYVVNFIYVLFNHALSSSHCIALHETIINPSAWGHLKPSSYCGVGRFFYEVFKFRAKLCRSLFKIM